MINQTRKRMSVLRGGTTTVEFALTAPLLFLLLMGAIEFSRANMLQHTAVVAATEGARRSIIPGATAQECKAAAESELAAVGFRTANVLIDPAVITDDTTQVTVNVSIPMSGENGFVLPKFLKGAKITKAVTLQRELAVENPDSERSDSDSENTGAEEDHSGP